METPDSKFRTSPKDFLATISFKSVFCNVRIEKLRTREDILFVCMYFCNSTRWDELKVQDIHSLKAKRISVFKSITIQIGFTCLTHNSCLNTLTSCMEFIITYLPKCTTKL